jgi:hypothetical protein
MAAWNGHLGLCRFLLRETSFPADNAVLSSALKRVQQHAWRGYRGLDETLLEDFYRLLVGEHNLEIDLLEPPTSLRDIYELAHTKTSFGVVLASQPTPFADLPLAQKFSAAMEASGWPAEALTMMLNHHNPKEVATRITEDGKTALHWAAAHLGEWLRVDELGLVNPYVSRSIESYAKLASDLIRVGADVHALWHEETQMAFGVPSLQRYDPFIILLKGVRLQLRHLWTRRSMAQAVSLWGQVLVEGGVHLDNYIVTANEFLRSIEWSDLDIPTRDDHGSLFPVELWITKELTLAVEIVAIPRVTVWEAQATHMPGAWPISPLFVDMIIWRPGAMDECDGFYWVPSDTVYVRPQRNHIDAVSVSGGSDELAYDSILDDIRERSEEHVSQDDHGTVAKVLSQETRSRHSGRRASSEPPFEDRKATSGAEWTNRPVYMPSGWTFTLHKCPLDLRWHKRPGYRDLSFLRRNCMQGRCHRLRVSVEDDYGPTFEMWLLRNENHVHVAKRYAQRFCPEYMHMVEEALERANDRARLAMGPKRLEDVRVRWDPTVIL